MPRPFVPGFRVPAPVSGYGGGPRGNDEGVRGNDVGGLSEPRISRISRISQMPLPSPLAPVVLSEPGMGVVTIG